MSSFVQSIETEKVKRRKVQAKELEQEQEWRRLTVNRAARIMRRLGLSKVRAEQTDHGRRDAIAYYGGKKIIVGAFYGPGKHAAFLLPYSSWVDLAPDLRDLPAKLRIALSACG